MVRKEDSNFECKPLIGRMLSAEAFPAYPHSYPHKYVVESAGNRTVEILPHVLTIVTYFWLYTNAVGRPWPSASFRPRPCNLSTLKIVSHRSPMTVSLDGMEQLALPKLNC